jgi:hypothetical protein
MINKDKAVELFTQSWNECDTENKILVHNIYCRENSYDEEIYDNDEDFINEHFSSPSEAVRAAYYGDYRFSDPYVWFNGYANLESGEFENDLPYIDEKEMADWYIENFVELEDISEFADFIEYIENDDNEDINEEDE